jgi:hypothetical protein
VETSSRAVYTNHEQMASHYQTILAEDEQTRFLRDRWSNLADEGEAPFLLDRLFESLLRRADAEKEFVTSAAAYNQTMLELKQAEGTLLYSQNVQMGSSSDAGLPVLLVDALVPQAAPMSRTAARPVQPLRQARRLPPIPRR